MTKLIVSIFLSLFATQAFAQNYIDSKGREWRRLDARPLLQISVASILKVCAQDPCKGSVNGVDLTGMTWANHFEVIELMREFEAGAPSAASYQSVQRFQRAMGITYQTVSQYADIVNSQGLTSSVEAKTGKPLVASVHYMIYFGQIQPGAYSVAAGNAAAVSGRTVFLYRRTRR